MRDTKEKLRLTWGSQQRVDSDHVRVPSPMIGQYTLDSRTNSIRDTGTRRKRRWYKMGNLHQFILDGKRCGSGVAVCQQLSDTSQICVNSPWSMAEKTTSVSGL